MSEQELTANPSTVNEEPQEQVFEYQPVDEKGTNLGRMVRIKYKTHEEFVQGMVNANQEAVRSFYRLKAQKATVAVPQKTFKPTPLTADEEIQVGLEAQNPTTFASAVEKVVKSRLPIADLEKSAREAEQAQYQNRVTAALLTFQRNHLHDFYDCHANGLMLGNWLKSNDLALDNPDNMEIAYAALQDQLAVNPATQVTAPAVEPTPTANPTVTVQRTVSSGLVPGQQSGIRPIKKTGLSKKDAIALVRNKPEYNKIQRGVGQVTLDQLNAALNS